MAAAAQTWKDCTEIFSAASAALTHEKPMLHGADFSLARASNAVEMMDPKMDADACKTALVPLEDKVKDGSVAVAGLTAPQVIGLMDKLLTQHASYLEGHALPQTLFSHLYTQPALLNAMRSFLGKGPHPGARGPQPGPYVPAHIAVPADESAAAPPVAAAASGVASGTPGTAAHTTVLSLLAYVYGTLKIAACTQESVYRADIWSEDDFMQSPYGTDCAWSMSGEEVLSLIQEAETAVAAACPAAAATINEQVAAALVAAGGGEDGGDGEGGSGSGSGGSKKKKGKKKTGKPDAADSATAADATAAPVVPPELQPAWAPSVEAGASASAAAALPEAAALALLSRLRFIRGLLIASLLMTPSRALPAPAPFKFGLIYQLRPVLHALHVAYSALGVVERTASEAGEFGPPTVAAADVKPSVWEGYGCSKDYGLAYIVGQQPRFAPATFALLPAALAALRKHLVGGSQVCNLPAIASYNPNRYHESAIPRGIQVEDPCGTVPLSALGAAAAALAAEGPLPVLPASGIVDAPLQQDWMSAETINVRVAELAARVASEGDEAAAAAAAAAAEASSKAAAPAAAAAPATPRSHVSLMAIFNFLEEWSRRLDDIVIRSWMRLLLPTPLTQAQQDSLLPPGLSSLPAVAVAETEWRLAQMVSSSIFGTHTVFELVQGSLLDVGIPAEQVWTVEGTTTIRLADTIFCMLLPALCSNRLRLYRKMDGMFQLDLSALVAECQDWDARYNQYVRSRLAALQTHADAGLPAPPLPTATLAAAADKSSALFEAADKYTNAFASVDRQHMLWLFHLLRFSAANGSTATRWATMFVYRMMIFSLQSALEGGIIHADELCSVYWYLQGLHDSLIATYSYLESGKLVRGAAPALQARSTEAVALWNTGIGPYLLRNGTKLPDEAGSEGPKKSSKLAEKAAKVTEQVGKAAETLLTSIDDALTSTRDVELLRQERALSTLLSHLLALSSQAGMLRGPDAVSYPPDTSAAEGEKWVPPPDAKFYRHPAKAFELRFRHFNGLGPFARGYDKYVSAFPPLYSAESWAETTREQQKSATGIRAITQEFVTETDACLPKPSAPGSTAVTAAKAGGAKRDPIARSCYALLMSQRDKQVASRIMRLGVANGVYAGRLATSAAALAGAAAVSKTRDARLPASIASQHNRYNKQRIAAGQPALSVRESLSSFDEARLAAVETLLPRAEAGEDVLAAAIEANPVPMLPAPVVDTAADIRKDYVVLKLPEGL